MPAYALERYSCPGLLIAPASELITHRVCIEQNLLRPNLNPQLLERYIAEIIVESQLHQMPPHVIPSAYVKIADHDNQMTHEPRSLWHRMRRDASNSQQP